MRVVLGLVAAVLGTVSLALIYLQGLINDNSVPVVQFAQSKDRVLFVFAHPDDEITVAGTLADLAFRGIPTATFYLTRGEAGPTGGLVPPSELGVRRTQETERVAEILGVQELVMARFPDGGTQHVAADDIQAAIRGAIENFSPTIVVSLDDKVGLYGHIDHAMAGKHTRAVVAELGSDLPYYQITLSQPTIDMALQMSEIFRERYPRTPGDGLPPATHAVEISKHGATKWAAVLAHETQWEVLDDVQPYGSRVPALIYYRVFNKEYLHRVQ